MDFMKGLSNAGFGKKKFGDRGGYEDKEEPKPFSPGGDMGDGNEEGKMHEEKETTEEEKQEEKKGDDDGAIDQETVDQIIELYDQITPLIDKLRKK